MIRLLTIADAPAIQTIVDASRRYHFDAALLFRNNGNQSLVVGDTALPALCRGEHEKLSVAQRNLAPPNLRTLLNNSNGFATHITDLIPLSASNPSANVNKIPLLASALKYVNDHFPVLAARPVWAAFDGDFSDAEGAALVAQMKLLFPNGSTSGRLIWMNTLSNAAAAVAQYAVVIS